MNNYHDLSSTFRAKRQAATQGEWQYSGQRSSIGNNHFHVVGPPSRGAVANVWDTQSPVGEANADFIA